MVVTLLRLRRTLSKEERVATAPSSEGKSKSFASLYGHFDAILVDVFLWLCEARSILTNVRVLALDMARMSGILTAYLEVFE